MWTEKNFPTLVSQPHHSFRPPTSQLCMCRNANIQWRHLSSGLYFCSQLCVGGNPDIHRGRFVLGLIPRPTCNTTTHSGLPLPDNFYVQTPTFSGGFCPRALLFPRRMRAVHHIDYHRRAAGLCMGADEGHDCHGLRLCRGAEIPPSLRGGCC